MVEVEEEVVNWEIGWFEASTLVRGGPIGNFWVNTDEKEGTKARKVHFDLDCSEDNVYLACLIDKAKELGVSFG